MQSAPWSRPYASEAHRGSRATRRTRHMPEAIRQGLGTTRDVAIHHAQTEITVIPVQETKGQKDLSPLSRPYYLHATYPSSKLLAYSAP